MATTYTVGAAGGALLFNEVAVTNFGSGQTVDGELGFVFDPVNTLELKHNFIAGDLMLLAVDSTLMTPVPPVLTLTPDITTDTGTLAVLVNNTNGIRIENNTISVPGQVDEVNIIVDANSTVRISQFKLFAPGSPSTVQVPPGDITATYSTDNGGTFVALPAAQDVVNLKGAFLLPTFNGLLLQNTTNAPQILFKATFTARDISNCVYADIGATWTATLTDNEARGMNLQFDWLLSSVSQQLTTFTWFTYNSQFGPSQAITTMNDTEHNWRATSTGVWDIIANAPLFQSIDAVDQVYSNNTLPTTTFSGTTNGMVLTGQAGAGLSLEFSGPSPFGVLSSRISTQFDDGVSAFNLNNAKLKQVGTPTEANDATTKQYVDARVNTAATITDVVRFNQTVKAISSDNINITGFGADPVADGITILDTELVLLTDQTNQPENGLYRFDVTSGDLIREPNEPNGRMFLANAGEFNSRVHFIQSDETDYLPFDANKTQMANSFIVVAADITNVNLALPLPEVDSVPLHNLTDLFLLAGQTDPKENGIYKLDAGGLPVRDTITNNGKDTANQLIYVEFGAFRANTFFQLKDGFVEYDGQMSLSFQQATNRIRPDNLFASTRAWSDSYIDRTTVTSIDGVTLANLDTVLLSNQPIPFREQNGAWIFHTGLGLDEKVWDDDVSLQDAQVLVREGTVHAGAMVTQFNAVRAYNGSSDETWTQTNQISTFTNDYQSCKCASTTNENLASAAPATLDGVPISNGDRVFLSSQSVSGENGVYDITAGNFVAYNPGTQRKNMLAIISQGTLYGGATFTQRVSTLSSLNEGWSLTGPRPDRSSQGVVEIVRVVSLGNVSPLTTSVIDGITIVDTDRVLLRFQSTPTDNGVYVRTGGTLVRDNTNLPYYRNARIVVTSGNTMAGATFLLKSMYQTAGTDTLNIVQQGLNNNPVLPIGQAISTPSVDVCPQTQVTVASPNPTYDGVELQNGMTVLLTRQTTTPSENGIWTFNGVGSAMTRNNAIYGAMFPVNATVAIKMGDIDRGSVYVNVRHAADVTIGHVTEWFKLSGRAPDEVKGIPSGASVTYFSDANLPDLVPGTTFIVDGYQVQNGETVCLGGQTGISSNLSGIFSYNATTGILTSTGIMSTGFLAKGVVVYVQRGVSYGQNWFQQTANYVTNTFGVEAVWTRLCDRRDTMTRYNARAVETTSNIDISTQGSGTVVDGVTLATNDQVLLLAQTASVDNGLYNVNASTMTRSTDMADQSIVRATALVHVAEGTINADHVFMHTGTDQIVDEDTLDFLDINANTTGQVTIDIVENTDATKAVVMPTGSANPWSMLGVTPLNTAGVLNISSAGVVTSMVSDRRYKKDIVGMTKGLETLLALEPCTWYWNERYPGGNEDMRQIGFLAQQLEEAKFSEGVRTSSRVFTDEEKAVNASLLDNCKNINDTAIIALLVNAVKDLHEQVTRLTERVAYLEQKCAQK
jgi:hypothetical protein